MNRSRGIAVLRDRENCTAGGVGQQNEPIIAALGTAGANSDARTTPRSSPWRTRSACGSPAVGLVLLPSEETNPVGVSNGSGGPASMGSISKSTSAGNRSVCSWLTSQATNWCELSRTRRSCRRDGRSTEPANGEGRQRDGATTAVSGSGSIVRVTRSSNCSAAILNGGRAMRFSTFRCRTTGVLKRNLVSIDRTPIGCKSSGRAPCFAANVKCERRFF